ncbi:signal transduction histidine kinase [Methylocella silvestris BL2]|uniref:histidine kinase n=1 Tax=Methylocella silvestris (strain DSM 15510 / CIP 108128 / LMG 27833 / NCIMB 13906 / BL2) TaxID=395965 RepID=B8ELH4_METSB|nr:histidine kinase dimerization/phosphoacceptor domain -containing protein [Methylocella silvestris]ACK49563.1 signal transduction histidine kinase [Methylocella silvestris BL2]
MADDDTPEQIDQLLTSPQLAEALESEQFRRFLDQAPIALVASDMRGEERIVYANPEFEKISGQSPSELEGQPWSALRGRMIESNVALGEAIVAGADYLGSSAIEPPGAEVTIIDIYANVIEDDDGAAIFRLASFAPNRAAQESDREALANQLRDKDMALKEIQHRVRNNLQMIAALIRYEARIAGDSAARGPFDKIAGRIEALQLLYRSMADDALGQEVDLGSYLSQIASHVMRAHAREGITLDLKVDAYPVSVNVAMPTGLVVNELMTNALKHAFAEREGGTISLQFHVDASGCRIEISDDGQGLPEGVEWPRRGKLSELIVRSLRQNAGAQMIVESKPGEGLRVIIIFTRQAASVEADASQSAAD